MKKNNISKHRQYKLLKDWPQLPGDLILGNPTGIGINSDQNLVVFHRAERKWPADNIIPRVYIPSQTILVIDRKTGKIISGWGEGIFVMPHGLFIDMQNNIWVTDVGLHQVFKFDSHGKLLMKLGEAFVKGKDSSHFSYPTDIVVISDGSFYVSDGYGNSRVIKFSPFGEYLFEWGRRGDQNSEFNLPHAITLDSHENIYIADRENSRIQVFDRAGNFIKKYSGKDFGKMSSVAFRNNSEEFAAVDFVVSGDKEDKYHSGILLFDSGGSLIYRLTDDNLEKIGANSWYHNILIDNDDNLYVTDIFRNRILKFIPE